MFGMRLPRLLPWSRGGAGQAASVEGVFWMYRPTQRVSTTCKFTLKGRCALTAACALGAHYYYIFSRATEIRIS